MVTAPVLALLDFDQLFIVEYDAPGHGLTLREQLKPIYERELMEIVLSIQKWRHYLLGRRFVVRIDQQSLKYLLEQRAITLDYQRWLTRILGYEFDIKYKVGRENRVDDGLLRIDHAAVEDVALTMLALTVPVILQMHDMYRETDENWEIQALITKVQSGDTVKQDFSLVNGRLFYK
ncbi:hypothetical protein N665_0267s0013 [Sinapis alba]|nr:hypothetical protein N665_0267s0013 [Sinapis alba]